jgi:hypothetical protein
MWPAALSHVSGISLPRVSVITSSHHENTPNS